MYITLLYIDRDTYHRETVLIGLPTMSREIGFTMVGRLSYNGN